MNAKIQTPKQMAVTPAILGVLAALVIIAVLTGASAQLPLIASDRVALIVLTVLGMAMCAVGGIGPTLARRGWKAPVTIAGAALGVLALAIVGAVLAGIPLPLISDDRAAIVALGAIGAVKVAVTIVDNR